MKFNISDWTEFFIAFGGIVGGFSLRPLFNFLSSRDTFKSKGISLVIDQQTNLIKKLEKDLQISSIKIDDLENENFSLKEKVYILTNKLQLLESSAMDLPLAMWMKDTKGVMVGLNNHYEDIFLKPRGYNIYDYLGKTDYEIWPEDVAKVYGENDKYVLENDVVVARREPVTFEDGTIVYYIVIKFLRKLGNLKLGVSGIAIDERLIED